MRAPWLRLGLDSQLGATQDQRGALTSEIGGTGVADVLAYVGKNAADTYTRHVLIPLIAADIDASALTDGLLNVASGVVGSQTTLLVAKVNAAALTDGVATIASGVFGSTLNLTINSIVNAGMIRTGSGGTPTITTGATDGPSAGNSATITSAAGGDYHSEFVLNANGTTSSGKIVTVAFSSSLANSSYDVIFLSRNGNAADLHFYLNSRATTGFTIGARVAPTSGQPFNMSYLVVGR